LAAKNKNTLNEDKTFLRLKTLKEFYILFVICEVSPSLLSLSFLFSSAALLSPFCHFDKRGPGASSAFSASK